MTHLSDSVYLDRALQDLVVLVYIIYVILWKRDRFALFTINDKTPKWKLAVAICLLLSLILDLMYFTITCYIKYFEGLKPDGDDAGTCREAGYAEMSPTHQQLISVMDWLFSLDNTFFSSACFLLMAYWRHLTKRVFKIEAMRMRRFTESLSFRVYTCYSIISVVLYIIVTSVTYSQNVNVTRWLRILVPQMLQTFEGTVIMIFVIKSNRSLAKRFKQMNSSVFSKVKNHIQFWIMCNNLLALGIFLQIATLTILNMDILLHLSDVTKGQTSESLVYKHRFLVEFLMKFFVWGYGISMWALFSILFPPNTLFVQPENHVYFSTSDRGYSASGKMTAVTIEPTLRTQANTIKTMFDGADEARTVQPVEPRTVQPVEPSDFANNAERSAIELGTIETGSPQASTKELL